MQGGLRLQFIARYTWCTMRVTHRQGKEGLILHVGDVALGGRKLSEEEGHFNDSRKPKGFDTKQIFVSPSVRYSGHDSYAKPKGYVNAFSLSFHQLFLYLVTCSVQ